ncbi:tetratricopeptide repeat protein [Bacteroides sp. OttesenSCG-928-E20]|nr:tetratricopeptide repeat protein [Bacteroides sp. OttesenSCG-928-E20]
MTDPVLLRADSLMECCADSALVLLENIEYPQEMKRSERALYGLLLTKARDKCLVEHVGDSLILATVNYYEKYNDDNKKAEAYFYLGSVYRDMGMTLNEIEAFQKALQAKGDKEDRMTALICNNLSALYTGQDCFDDALSMAKKAYTVSLKLDNQSDIIHFTRNLGVAYQTIEKQDSSLICYKYALDRVYATHENELEGLLCSDIGEIYAQKNLIDSAFYYFSKSMRLLPTEDVSFFTLYSMGKIYHQLGQLDSAKIHLIPCLDADDIYVRASSRLALTDIEKKTGNLKEYLRYNEEYLAINDTIDANSRRKDTKTLIDKNILKELMAQRSYSILKSIQPFVVFLLITLFIILIITIRLSLKKRKLNKKEESKQLTPPSLLVDNKRIMVQISRDSERFAKCICALKDAFNDTIFVDLQRNPKKKIALRQENREALKKNTTSAFSEIIHDLSISFPKLHDDDLYCCILYLLNFESRTIESIMGVENVTLRGRRSRIRKNIAPEVYTYIFEKKQ